MTQAGSRQPLAEGRSNAARDEDVFCRFWYPLRHGLSRYQGSPTLVCTSACRWARWVIWPLPGPENQDSMTDR
jgi:hypothetical protein